jgi:hypothetical protein
MNIFWNIYLSKPISSPIIFNEDQLYIFAMNSFNSVGTIFKGNYSQVFKISNQEFIASYSSRITSHNQIQSLGVQTRDLGGLVLCNLSTVNIS